MPVNCLIVDDSAEFLASATRLLVLEGLMVVGGASSGEAALGLAQVLRPDVALVDVELGDEDGIELSRRLTTTEPPTKVILVSGRDRGELSELTAESGALGFLRKDTLDAQAVMELLCTGPTLDRSPEPRSAAEVTDRAHQALREELALRSVAMLVAADAPQGEIFDAVVREATGLLGAERVCIERVADPAHMTGAILRIAQSSDVDHLVATPIVVGGALWGLLAAVSTTDSSWSGRARALLGGFCQLAASALANAEARAEERKLAEQQGALRRVATLVAQGARPEQVFDAITEQASQVLGVDAIALGSYDATIRMFTQMAATPGRRLVVANGEQWSLDESHLGALMVSTGRPARIDDWAPLTGRIAERYRESGFEQSASAPILIEGSVWGFIQAYGERDKTLPLGCEERLAEFTQLMATAIANLQARDELRSLAESQGALRRIATLAAGGAGPGHLFEVIAEEASRILRVGAISLVSYDPATRMFTQIAATHGERAVMPTGGHWSRDSSPLGSLIVDTGRPARIDDWTMLPGPVAATHRDNGFGQAVGAPIVVDGSVWGFIGAFGEAGETLPSVCEVRLAEFTQLMATAIANLQARDDLRSLAESQGALRRVATLVAQGAEPSVVFAAVALEAAGVLGVGAVSLFRYDAGNQVFTKVFGTHGERALVADGEAVSPEDCPEGALVVRTGQPARINDWAKIPGPMAARHLEQGYGEAVAAPVLVDGEIWGHIGAYGKKAQVLPAGCERRLADFTHLMASAIANAGTRDELRGLAERQGAALRRVATLVAQQASPNVIFSAVAEEASRALGVTRVDVGRFQEDGSLKLLGSTPRLYVSGEQAVQGSARYVAGKVLASGRAVRVDDWPSLGALENEGTAPDCFRSVVGAPIIVDGSAWGVILVLSVEKLRDDTETRLTDFTHLVASSISNVNARNNLIASRARIVAAGDETRRRIERNLHDGVQQRLVALGLCLRAVCAGLPWSSDTRSELQEVTHDLEGVIEEIRVFSQGLHPALLSRGGLGPSLRELARRAPIQVNLDVPRDQRFPEPIETAVYYVVSEALANATKHSRASEVSVSVVSNGAGVRATVADNGVGGAAPGGSSGLVGLVDRVEALGGKFTLESPIGRGTMLSIELPLVSQTTDDHITF